MMKQTLFICMLYKKKGGITAAVINMTYDLRSFNHLEVLGIKVILSTDCENARRYAISMIDDFVPGIRYGVAVYEKDGYISFHVTTSFKEAVAINGYDNIVNIKQDWEDRYNKFIFTNEAICDIGKIKYSVDNNKALSPILNSVSETQAWLSDYRLSEKREQKKATTVAKAVSIVEPWSWKEESPRRLGFGDVVRHYDGYGTHAGIILGEKGNRTFDVAFLSTNPTWSNLSIPISEEYYNMIWVLAHRSPVIKKFRATYLCFKPKVAEDDLELVVGEHFVPGLFLDFVRNNFAEIRKVGT